MLLHRKILQDFLQVPWREFAGSTCGPHAFGQPDGFQIAHLLHLILFRTPSLCGLCER
jgi:hypothetical protein